MSGPGRGGAMRADVPLDVLDAFPFAVIMFSPSLEILYWNAAATSLFGWDADEALGRNPNDLGLVEHEPARGRAFSAMLGAGSTWRGALTLRTRKGQPVVTDVTAAPVHSGASPRAMVVVARDVTQQRLMDAAVSSRLLEAERRAKAETDRAHARLALLAEAGARLASSLEPKTTLDNVARLIVPRMAEICIVDLLDEGRLERTVVAGGSGTSERVADQLRTTVPVLDGSSYHPVASVLNSGEPLLLPQVAASDADRWSCRGTEVDAVRRPSALHEYVGRSMIVTPLVARRRVLGTLTMIGNGDAPAYDEADFYVAGELARRAALAIDNARLYANERRIADELQRSLMPSGPLRAPGVTVAVRYLPGEREADVGGDFYDVITPASGPWTGVVGDVGGKGVRAAAIMGQLRTAIRAYALEGHGPSGVVRRLDALFEVMDASDFSTCLVSTFDPQASVLTWANAGHPPALVRRADGRCALLDRETGVPLGCGQDHVPAESSTVLHPGELVVLYSDGLVERRGESLDVGLARLAEAVRTGPDDPDSLCTHVLNRLLGTSRSDDVVLMIFRVD